jgi:hypothetical protein
MIFQDREIVPVVEDVRRFLLFSHADDAYAWDAWFAARSPVRR